MSTQCDKIFWFEFIEEFKKMRPLWDQRCAGYSSKIAKQKCYEILVQKVRTIYASADINFVRSKIESFRSAYRREKYKVINSIKAGKEIYEPTWCFYPKLMFIDFAPFNQKRPSIRRKLSSVKKNTEMPINNQSSVDPGKCGQIPQSHQDSTEHYPSTSTEMMRNQYLSEQIVDHEPQPAWTNENEESAFTGEMLSVIHNYFKRPVAEEDQCDMIGKCFASKLKMVDRKQRLIVEKLMNEALWEAEQGNLTVNHRVCNAHRNIHSHHPSGLPVNTHSPYSIESSQCVSPVPLDSQLIYSCDELEVKKEEPDA